MILCANRNGDKLSSSLKDQVDGAGCWINLYILIMFRSVKSDGSAWKSGEAWTVVWIVVLWYHVGQPLDLKA